ncbi:unnamed protein product [Paramecium octaurelia]|uniref:Uncharacterized protein n=1 Tax=Paramecium octaurelia TaxID=43137 RepID=A0A8S1V450_PAROT|nr:unnamed protein product [Paramecium octaurelia]
MQQLGIKLTEKENQISKEYKSEHSLNKSVISVRIRLLKKSSRLIDIYGILHEEIIQQHSQGNENFNIGNDQNCDLNQISYNADLISE